jgi:hypothetical protein
VGSITYRDTPIFCGTINATAESVTGKELEAMMQCLNSPASGGCFMVPQTQATILATGCIDCLHYIQNTQQRVKTYCEPMKTQAECEATRASCEHSDPGGALIHHTLISSTVGSAQRGEYRHNLHHYSVAMLNRMVPCASSRCHACGVLSGCLHSRCGGGRPAD